MDPVQVPGDTPDAIQMDRARLERRMEQLLHQSEERKAHLELIKAEVEILRSTTTAELRRMGDTIIKLTIEKEEQRGAARRCYGQQVQLVQALRALVDATVVCSEWRNGDEAYAMLRQVVREAHELLALVEVPFG